MPWLSLKPFRISDDAMGPLTVYQYFWPICDNIANHNFEHVSYSLKF